MKVQGKSGGILVALVFALAFGGVGAFASWVVGSTLWSAWEAKGWTRVPAEVLHYDDGRVQYRYELNERTYLGTRIGIAAIESDEGNPEAGSRIQQAVNDKQPLEVLVDPNEPSRSVIDTTIPWKMVIGFLPFALGFGTVGLGALGVLVSLLLPDRADDDEESAIGCDAAGGFLGLALFTFLWNAIAFPIAAVMMMEVWKSGDWAVLLVLIFPLIGLLMIWSTINAAINWIRRGGAKVHPQQTPPRRGGPFSGYVAFARGVTPGDAFKAVLKCTPNDSNNQAAFTHWKGEQQVRVSDVGGRRRLTFRFDTPDRIEGIERDAETQWQLDLHPDGKEAAAFSFSFKMQPPFGVEHLPEEELGPAMVGDDDEPQLVPAGLPKGLEGIAAIVGKEVMEEKLRKMPAAERAQLHARFEQMTSHQKEALAKYAQYMPMVKKLVFWVIGLFILVQVIGVVSFFLFST